MRKSSLAAMMLGTFSGVLFALGMCMVLVTEWGYFRPGIVFTGAGIVLGIVSAALWRKMENKQLFKISGRKVVTIAVGIAGTLALGIGMCFSMVWSQMIPGILIGLAGILMILLTIPLIKGIES